MMRLLITYWVSTALVALVLGISGGLAITHSGMMMNGLAHLGYPPYFANLLGVGKLLGLVIFLAPGVPRLKEWVYAGFTITVLSACYSHYSSGDGVLALEPLLTFATLMVSYTTRPHGRSLLRARTGYGKEAKQ